MKFLYILLEDIRPTSGVGKKVLGQCDGLRSNGVDVELLCLKNRNGEMIAVVNDKPIHSYGKGRFKHIKFLIEYDYIIKYIRDNSIDVTYTRFSRISPFLVLLFRKIKKIHITSLMEVPTYPYDKEVSGKKRLIIKLYFALRFTLDKIMRRFYKYYVDRIVTVQNYDQILNLPTIKITNGIDLRNVPLLSPQKHEGFNILGIGELRAEHGYDRIIEGIGIYYANGGKEDVKFYIIGNYTNIIEDYKKIIEKYNIADRIHLEGAKEGVELDKYFDVTDIAIGSLGGFRQGLFDAKPLKCAEFAARGIPFIYSEPNSDFDNCNFIRIEPQDDTPIDIDSLIRFRRSLNMDPSEIRNYVKDNLTWDIVMKKVVDYVS